MSAADDWIVYSFPGGAVYYTNEVTRVVLDDPKHLPVAVPIPPAIGEVWVDANGFQYLVDRALRTVKAVGAVHDQGV